MREGKLFSRWVQASFHKEVKILKDIYLDKENIANDNQLQGILRSLI